jgi:RNA polymerase sigma factor (sigma-70 family)
MGEAGGVTVGGKEPGERGLVKGYAQHRPLLFSIAYRMTGSVTDAEDIVQEAFARLAQAVRSGTTVSEPKAYLATAATRLALNHLRSARRRRESYRGTLAARAGPHRPRSRGARGDGRFAFHGVPRRDGVPVAGRARRVPAARGLRLRAQGDRRDNRRVGGKLPAGPGPGPASYRRGKAALRGVPRAAPGSRAAVLRRRRRRRPGRAAAGAGPGRGLLRRRRGQGACDRDADARPGPGRPVPHRAVSADPEAGR